MTAIELQRKGFKALFDALGIEVVVIIPKSAISG